MRPIKFRAWSSRERKWYYFGFDSLFSHDNQVAIGKERDSAKCLNHPEHGINPDLDIQQFTGLLDKNGKEIYEGDIVENSAKIAWIIEFDIEQGRYRYFRPENSLDEVRRTGFGLTNNQSKVLKVIGNIHESKHLLDNIDTKI